MRTAVMFTFAGFHFPQHEAGRVKCVQWVGVLHCIFGEVYLTFIDPSWEIHLLHLTHAKY